MLSKNTLFEFLYQNLHDQITCGHLKPGDTLPSMPQLAAIYNVGIRTVKDVLARLKTEGLIQTPFLRNGNKRNITIRELLFHESGLPPYIRFYLDIIDPNSVHGPYSQSWVDEWHRTQVSEHSYYCSDFKFRKGMVSDKNTPVYTLHMADGMWLNKSFKNSILQRIAKCELDGKRYEGCGHHPADLCIEVINVQSVLIFFTKFCH